MHSIQNPPARVFLGYAGEANARTLEIDVSPWLAEYPGAAVTVTYTRPGDPAVYPAAGVELAGSLLRWRIGAAAVARAGDGTAVIRCMQGEVEVHSALLYTRVSASHGPAGPAPDPIQDWMAEAGAAEQNRQAAEAERAEAEAARANSWEALEPLLEGWEGVALSVCGVRPVEGDVPLTGGDVPVSGSDPTAVAVILGSKLDTHQALTNFELEEMLR